MQRALLAVLAAAPLLLPAGLATAAPKYQLVNQSEFGKAFVAQRQDARSLASALRLTLADITAYLGSAPTSYRAYSDSRDPGSGGATFLANAGSIALKGLVTCKVGGKGARVAVVLLRADAPPEELGRLLDPSSSAGNPSQNGSADGKSITAAHAPLRTYSFPDGTGSVGLAEGWSTSGQSAVHPAILQGPAGETVTLGALFSIVTPNARFRAPSAVVAPFTTPAEVLQAVVPQLNQQSIQQGGPSRQIDGVVDLGETKPFSPRARQSVLRWGVTETERNGMSTHFRVMGQVTINPTSQTSFLLGLTTARAPDATFERDLPVMLEMINSVKMNEGRIRQQSGQAVAAQQRWFQAQQKAHKQQVAAFDAHNRQWEANEKAFDQRNQDLADRQNVQARSNDNFDELIRGYRTVEDTQSGVKTSVDLGNVTKIVDDLNEHDPGRYREIPLRDEVDPVRGQ